MLLDFASAVPQVTPLAFDATGVGYAVVLIDSRQDHSVHTEEFASVPADMRMVANHLGVARLGRHDRGRAAREPAGCSRGAGRQGAPCGRCTTSTRWPGSIGSVRALEAGDFPLFLKCVRLSGASSAQFLQNVSPRDTGSGSANQPCSSRGCARTCSAKRAPGASTAAASAARCWHSCPEPRVADFMETMDKAARLPRLPRGGRGRPRRAGEAAVVSGAARGVEGASGYAVDEARQSFLDIQFSGGAAGDHCQFSQT